MKAKPSLSIAALIAIALSAAAPSQTPKEDAVMLATALNRFGVDLCAQISSSGPATCSPASIGIALLMVLPGARGETAAELEKVLQLPADLRGDRLHRAAQQLLDSLRAASSDAKKLELRLVDEFWVQNGFELLPAYVRTLKEHFASAAHGVDFARDPEAARSQINAAIATATNQRIPELIPADLIDSDTRLVLTNALWLRGAWQHPFGESATKPAAFTLADGKQVEVPTMHVTERFGYAQNAHWQVVRMPFADPAITCDVLLPAAGEKLDAMQAELLAGDYQAALQPAAVHIAMPKFRVAAAHRLRKPLEALGMRSAFDASADFSGMRSGRDLAVSEVVHQTWIDVDEKGAEAAAATAVIMKRGSAHPRDPKQFRADRPFVFVIRHAATGLVLFTGRVDDPSAAPQ
ncbi:MAG: serpin family protein [Planctomycetes bacterium]|nr:serpin family protein [Planctomycetota bacterium]MCB9884237.1 serpin family protein [Planctomycetota bacterium]